MELLFAIFAMNCSRTSLAMTRTRYKACQGYSVRVAQQGFKWHIGKFLRRKLNTTRRLENIANIAAEI